MFLNSEISLSPRELLFIAALLEATEFMGVSDAFFGMDEAEMHQETINLQSSLEEKGYAEMDFDGSFTLKDDVREMVDVCANCDTFIVVDRCKSGKLPLRDLYYAKSGRFVKLSEGADSNVLLPLSGADSLIELISKDIEWQTTGASMLKDVRITNEILSDAKSKANELDQSVSIKILMDNGCDELSAKTIISGLLGKSDYFAVIVTVFGGEREGVYSVMLTSNENGIYRLVPIADTEQETVQFNMIETTDVKIILTDTIRSAFPSESEGFA